MSGVDVLPPHDVASEEAIVAALLLDDDAALRLVGTGLQPAHFYREAHGWAYAAAIALSERGESVTIPTLAHELREAGHLDRVGGEPWLAEIVGRHFTAIGVEAHARIVTRDALYRRLIAAAGDIARRAYAGGSDPDSVITAAERALDEAIAEQTNSGAHTLGELMASDEAIDRELITAGYPSLTYRLRGLGLGELCVIGGRQNDGKTAFAAGMAVRQALSGIPTAYLPIEGDWKRVAARMAADQCGYSIGWARRHGHDIGDYQATLANIADLDTLYFPRERQTPRTPQAIAAWMTRAARLHGVQVIYIDHMDQISYEVGRGQNEASAIGAALQQWVDVCLRERIALVVLSQINRETAREDQVVPSEWGLRGAGAKAEKAQTILMLGAEQDDSPALRESRIVSVDGGRWLHVHVRKAKEWIERPELTVPVDQYQEWPAFALDRRSGAALDLGERR